MRFGWGLGWGGMALMMGFWVLVLVLAGWALHAMFPGRTPVAPEPDAREILARRFARGEITREQYEDMLAVIRRSDEGDGRPG